MNIQKYDTKKNQKNYSFVTDFIQIKKKKTIPILNHRKHTYTPHIQQLLKTSSKFEIKEKRNRNKSSEQKKKKINSEYRKRREARNKK